MEKKIWDVSELTESDLRGNNEFINFDEKDLVKAIVESSLEDGEEA